jgi:hypothetical protein
VDADSVTIKDDSVVVVKFVSVIDVTLAIDVKLSIDEGIPGSRRDKVGLSWI